MALGALATAWAGQAALASPPPSEESAGTVESTIILLDRRPGGHLVFRLANGQVWEQRDARFMAVQAGEQVVIAPARLGGGHILATERSATARVRRLEEPSAGEREGPAPRKKEPSAGEREGPAPRNRTH